MAVRTWTLELKGDERDLVRATRKADREVDRLQRSVNKHFRGIQATAKKAGDSTGGSFSKGIDRADRDLDRFDRNSKRRFARIRGSISSTGRVFATAFGGAALAGIAAAGLGLKAMVSEARESQKVNRETARVIKSMGADSFTSSKQVSRLSTRLSNLSAIDDEVIQSGANLMLTFGKVRNEMGKGNNVFDRSVSLANDMSVALGKDMRSSTIMLGKALNDPIKGLTAMGRAGVSFTQSQRDAVKVMVESGDILGAQRLILDEVTRQFGGAAKAAANPWERLKVTVGNMAEEVGGHLLPVIDRASLWLADRLPGALDRVSGWFGTARTSVSEFWTALTTGMTQNEGGTWWEDLGLKLNPLVEKLPIVTGHLKDLTRWVSDNRTEIAAFVRQWAPVVATFVGVIAIGSKVVAVLVALKGAAAALGVVLAINPVTLLIVALAALAAGLVVAYQRSEEFRRVVQGVWQWIQTEAVPAVVRFWGSIVEGAQAVWAEVQPTLLTIGRFLRTEVMKWVTWFRENWASIREAVVHTLNFLKTIIGVVIGVISVAWKMFGDDIMLVVRTAWDYVRNTISNVMQVVRGIISFVLALINGDWGKAWAAIRQILSAVWSQIVNTVRTGIGFARAILSAGWELIKTGWQTAWRTIRDWFSALWEGIKAVVNAGIHWVGTRLSNAWDTITEAWKTVWRGIRTWFGNAWSGIKSVVMNGVNAVIGVINWFIRGYNKVRDAIDKVPGVPAPPRINELSEIGTSTPGRSGSGRSSLPGGPPGTRMAAGGAVDPHRAGPFVTDGIRAIVGEGRQQYPEYVIPTDPQHRGRASRFLMEAASKIGFAQGGTLPRGPGIAGLYDPLAAIVSRIVAEARGAVSVVSGWRDSAKQANLWRRWLAGTGNRAARPGTSDHERGAAVDFGGSRGVYQALAAKFGLVANVRGEPWHYIHPGQAGRGGLLGRAMQIIFSNLAGSIGPLVWSGRHKLNTMGTGTWTGMGHSLLGFAFEMAKGYDAMANAAAARMSASVGGGGMGATSGLEAGASANRALGQALAAGRGWTGALWQALDALVMSESGWRNTAQNPSSTAFGIGQFLNSTWASVGARKTSDPRAQIMAMFSYIAQRYGDPIKAWAFKRANNWYGRGGILSYSNGGTLTEDIVGHGRSGRAYMLHRGETVSNGGGSTFVRVEAGAVIIQVGAGDSEADAARKGRAAGKSFMDVLSERKVLTTAKIR